MTRSKKRKLLGQKRRRILNSIGELYVFLGLDYKAIEVRMLAEVSGDPLLIKQFRSGKDIHCLVGSTLTSWPLEKIAKDHEIRRSVKEFHFSLVYGVGKRNMHSHMMAKGVKITKRRLAQYYDNYFRKYRGVKRLIEKCRRRVEAVGSVKTLFDFEVRIEKDDERRGSYWGNRAINTPIQGSAHQLLLIALAIIKQKPKTYNLLRHWPLMEVHDALYFKTKVKDLAATLKQAKQLLERAVVEYAAKHFKVKLRVPLIAEAKAGFTLGSMVEYEGGSLLGWLRSWQAEYKKAADKAITLDEMMPHEIKALAAKGIKKVARKVVKKAA